MFFQCLTLITTEESCLLHNDKTIKRTHKDILAVLRFFFKKKEVGICFQAKKKSSYKFPVSFNHHSLKSWHQQIMKTFIKHSSSNFTSGSGSSFPKSKTTSLHAGGEEKPEIWQVCCLYPAGWNVADWQGNFSMHLLFTFVTSYSRTGTTWRANQYFPKQKHTTRLLYQFESHTIPHHADGTEYR